MVALVPSPAQRTAVQLRPHDQSKRSSVDKTEPVVLHHGREARPFTSRRRAAVCCNGLLGGAPHRRRNFPGYIILRRQRVVRAQKVLTESKARPVTMMVARNALPSAL